MLVGVDVEMIGRTVGKQLLQFIQTVRNIFLNVHLSLISSDHHEFRNYATFEIRVFFGHKIF